jgi:hypothetical protein
MGKTIRVSNETHNELKRIANEYTKMGREGFAGPFNIHPDKVIQEILKDWNSSGKGKHKGKVQ